MHGIDKHSLIKSRTFQVRIKSRPKMHRGVPKLTGVNLKVVWVEFSTLSYAVFVMSVFAWHRQALPHLE